MRYHQLISVAKQIWISFSLGKYKDSILYDVTHMDDCHLHLGNPWWRYRNVVYNPVKNYYRVVMERNYVLVPMSKEEAQRSVDGLQDRVRNWLDEKKDVDGRKLILLLAMIVLMQVMKSWKRMMLMFHVCWN